MVTSRKGIRWRLKAYVQQILAEKPYLIAHHHCVRCMPWVRGHIDCVTPGELGEWDFSDSCVDGGSITGVPNDESVGFSQGCQESIIGTKSQLLDADLHAFEDGDWHIGVLSPQEDWRIRQPLEDGSDLAHGDESSRPCNADGVGVRARASPELLHVLVVEVFQDQKSSDGLHKCLLVSWAVVHGVQVLSIVLNRELEFLGFHWGLQGGRPRTHARILLRVFRL